MKFKIENKNSSIESKVNAWIMFSMPGHPKNLALRYTTEAKIREILEKGELPKIVNKMAKVNKKLASPEMTPQKNEALIMLSHIADLLKQGFHPKTVLGMIKETMSESTDWGSEFGMKFYNLHLKKDLRAEVWGVTENVPICIARAILADIAAGINVDDPTDEEFEKSTALQMAKKLDC
ncbi:MAG: hypothetical protein J6W11_04125 [Alphaproteobacteria bacterium]|nr:hypothetical protein [Alphaproteobacteria bacterium]